MNNIVETIKENKIVAAAVVAVAAVGAGYVAGKAYVDRKINNAPEGEDVNIIDTKWLRVSLVRKA